MPHNASLAIIAVAVTILASVVVIALVISHINDNHTQTQQVTACVQSGGQWVHDGNGWANCVRH